MHDAWWWWWWWCWCWCQVSEELGRGEPAIGFKHLPPIWALKMHISYSSSTRNLKHPLFDGCFNWMMNHIFTRGMVVWSSRCNHGSLEKGFGRWDCFTNCWFLLPWSLGEWAKSNNSSHLHRDSDISWMISAIPPLWGRLHKQRLYIVATTFQVVSISFQNIDCFNDSGNHI